MVTKCALHQVPVTCLCLGPSAAMSPAGQGEKRNVRLRWADTPPHTVGVLSYAALGDSPERDAMSHPQDLWMGPYRPTTETQQVEFQTATVK